MKANRFGKLLATAAISMTFILMGPTAHALSPSDEQGRAAAVEAAVAAQPGGDKAALDAAKSVAAAALAYCDRSYAYLTGSLRYNYPIKQAVSGDETICYLEQGVRNNAVSTLQFALQKCYGKAIAVDGAFGPATYNALLQVQWTIGTTIDGIYGPNTAKKMRWPSTSGTFCRTLPVWA